MRRAARRQSSRLEPRCHPRPRRAPPLAAPLATSAAARPSPLSTFLFFFNDTAPTEIYTLPLPDALPISLPSPPAIPARRELAQWPRERVARSASASLLRPPALGPLR